MANFLPPDYLLCQLLLLTGPACHCMQTIYGKIETASSLLNLTMQSSAAGRAKVLLSVKANLDAAKQSMSGALSEIKGDIGKIVADVGDGPGPALGGGGHS